VFFGVISRFDGCVFCCDPSCVGVPTPTPKLDAQKRRIFDTKSGQFAIVVEGAPGGDNLAPSKSTIPNGVDGRPDIQIESTRSMGNGSTDICDTGPASMGGGGVPGINPTSFANTQAITDALTDFACRFEAFTAAPEAACTYIDDSGVSKPIISTASVQFCDFVAGTAAFPFGESILTVKLRDSAGNTGPTAQIIVRVATPTPTP